MSLKHSTQFNCLRFWWFFRRRVCKIEFLVQNSSNGNRTLGAVLLVWCVVCRSLYVSYDVPLPLCISLKYPFNWNRIQLEWEFSHAFFKRMHVFVAKEFFKWSLDIIFPTIICVRRFCFPNWSSKNTVDTTVFVLNWIGSNGDAALCAVVLCRGRARFILVFYTNSPNRAIWLQCDDTLRCFLNTREQDFVIRLCDFRRKEIAFSI